MSAADLHFARESGQGSAAPVARPNRKTVVFQGDGSGMYTPQTLWTMAREKADVTLVVMKNENYGILNIELARVREGEPNEKMLSMMHLDNPSLDWVKLAEAQGVPATRATTAEEFHQQFEAAMRTKGPRLIEARIVQDLKPVIDAVHNSRGYAEDHTNRIMPREGAPRVAGGGAGAAGVMEGALSARVEGATRRQRPYRLIWTR